MTRPKPTAPDLPLPLQFLAAWLAMWVCRHQKASIAYLREENRVLRERLGKKRLRLADPERRRLASLGAALGRKALAEVATIATPDTILRWYRELVAAKYDGSKKRRITGRPRKAAEIVRLLLKMATENPTWGYTRLRGALANLGYEVGRSTIARILAEHGIEPAPARKDRHSWATFIKAHMGALAAMDFFTVEVVTMVGLVRWHVLFVIDVGSRAVEIAGIARDPGGDWMKQIARNLLDATDGFLKGKRFLIIDRDPLYTADFRDMLAAGGVEPLRLPPSSPNLYMKHYHTERNHQGLGNRLIEAGAANDNGRVRRRERLGGLLSYYHREAA